MKDFFSNMNFPRWVILSMLLASGVLGWLVWTQSARLAEVEGELRRAPDLVKEIQQLSLRLDSLQSLADKEGLIGETDPEFYIQRIASLENVQIGAPSITPTVLSPFRGVEDHKYKIRPQDKTRRYKRVRIGNFLYKLEEESRKVKVTGIELTPTDRIRSGEIGEDNWTFEVELTSRQAAET